ncbi:MAG: C1 family peptidase [Syntrophales bacterium]
MKKTVTSILIVLGLILLPLKANADLETIKRAIKERGAKWQAGETSVSGLSLEEKKRFCGLKKPAPTEKMTQKTFEQQELPDTFDWRDWGGDWTTPIRNQGGCGSCWAFGALAAMEALINIEANDPSVDDDLSEQFLLSCSQGDCNGWYLSKTLNFLKRGGTVFESCIPYNAIDTRCLIEVIKGRKICPNLSTGKVKISGWGYVSPSVDSIRTALNLYGPLPAGMDIYDDFFNYTGGVYNHVSGGYVGDHLVAIVGYNNAEGYWICKNSWGTDWGESGWFKIKYGECSIGSPRWISYIEGIAH